MSTDLFGDLPDDVRRALEPSAVIGALFHVGDRVTWAATYKSDIRRAVVVDLGDSRICLKFDDTGELKWLPRLSAWLRKEETP